MLPRRITPFRCYLFEAGGREGERVVFFLPNENTFFTNPHFVSFHLSPSIHFRVSSSSSFLLFSFVFGCLEPRNMHALSSIAGGGGERGKCNARISLSLFLLVSLVRGRTNEKMVRSGTGYRLKKRGGEKFGRTIIPFILYLCYYHWKGLPFTPRSV